MLPLLRRLTTLDRGIAAIVVAGCLLQAVLSPQRWAWLAVPAVGVLVGSLVLVRRTRPELIIVGFLAGNVADLASTRFDVQWTESAAAGGAVVLLYSLGRYGRWPSWMWHATIITVAGVATDAVTHDDHAVLSKPDGQVLLAGAITQIGLTVLIVGLGRAVRHQDEQRMATIDAQRVNERQQLARDLHDVLAHCISAIALRADAAVSVADSNPEAARRALEQIRDTARESLSDIRQVVGILREEQITNPAPAPDLRMLDTLVGAGPPAVRVANHVDLDAVPLAASRALYRIAQEAVTNARRHARHATTISISTEACAQGLRLTVHDDGRTTGQPREGFGLRGMRERVELLNGSLTAGIDPYGGWTVVALIPTSGPAR